MGKIKHNHAKPNNRTYRTWESMRNRCRNPKNKAYRWYGAKGITVCPEWEDFSVFLRDMGERPEGKTLDRIDSSKNYCPENCTWSDWDTQANNRSNAVRVEYEDQLITVKELSERVFIPASLLYSRIFQSGWTVNEAIHRHKYKRYLDPARWRECEYCKGKAVFYVQYRPGSVRLVTRYFDGAKRIPCEKCKGVGGHWAPIAPTPKRRIAR